MPDVVTCANCGADIAFTHRTGWPHARWSTRGEPFSSWRCPHHGGAHVPTWKPKEHQVPTPKDIPGAVKCRYCTRLIKKELEGTWVRVNSSKSDPNRPDSVCIKSRDRKHTPVEQRKPRPPRNQKPPPGEPPGLQKRGLYQWRDFEGDVPPPPGYEMRPGDLPNYQNWPLNEDGGLDKLLGLGFQGFQGFQWEPGGGGTKFWNHELPGPIRSVCRHCILPVSLQWDDPEGLWKEDPAKDGNPEICGAPGNHFYHDPAGCCPVCGNVAEFCLHWKMDNTGTLNTIMRSLVNPNRWMTPGCCPDCWLAEELADDELHCHDCPCCDCKIHQECGLSRPFWSDSMGGVHDNPISAWKVDHDGEPVHTT